MHYLHCTETDYIAERITDSNFNTIERAHQLPAPYKDDFRSGCRKVLFRASVTRIITEDELLGLFLCRDKSKMFTSRLAEQRARLVVMLRRGDLPEELENEKIVELQLQKKQVCITMIYYSGLKVLLKIKSLFWPVLNG